MQIQLLVYKLVCLFPEDICILFRKLVCLLPLLYPGTSGICNHRYLGMPVFATGQDPCIRLSASVMIGQGNSFGFDLLLYKGTKRNMVIKKREHYANAWKHSEE